MSFTHFDKDGNSQMVDVSTKPSTIRTATAKATVIISAISAKMIEDRTFKKGDVLSVAQLAGIMGAKQTQNIIPLCHCLNLSSTSVKLELHGTKIEIIATCKSVGQTGVEMEALSAVTISALTVYDMCKSVDKAILITNIHLIHKSGGKSGTYQV